MTLPGDIMEELDSLVQVYNQALLHEKEAVKTKKTASDNILAILHEYQKSTTEAGGCTLTVKPWLRKTLVKELVEDYLTPEQMIQVVQMSTGVSLDVRPLRQT